MCFLHQFHRKKEKKDRQTNRGGGGGYIHFKKKVWAKCQSWSRAEHFKVFYLILLFLTISSGLVALTV